MNSPLTVTEVLKRWRELNDKQKLLEQKTLDLISHPEATDSQILAVCKSCAASRKKIAETKETVIQWLYKKGATLQANQLRGIR